MTTRSRVRSRYFLWMAVAIVAIAVIGFSRTWYLKPLMDSPALPLSVHLHGVTSTAWLLLYLMQSLLVDRRRMKLHRQLGMWGMLLAVVMAVSAFPAGIDTAVARGMTEHAVWRLALPFVVAPTFLLLVGFALYFRRDPAIHKRLMLLATIQAVSPALGRLPVLDQLGAAAFIGMMLLLLGSLVVYDITTLRRVHVSTIIGGLTVGISVPGRGILGTTAYWQDFAHRLVQ